MKRILGVLIAVTFMATAAFAAAPMSDPAAKSDPAVGKTIAVDAKAETCKVIMTEKKAVKEEIKFAKEKKDKKAVKAGKKKMSALKARWKAANCKRDHKAK
jgi:hypothetical protein